MIIVLAAAGGAAVNRAVTSRNPSGASLEFASPAALHAPVESAVVKPRQARRLGDSGAAVVYVAGAVVKPGVYTLGSRARAADALRAAGGATAQADLVAINLAAPLEDGQEIAVPVRGADGTVSEAVTAEAPAKRRPRHRVKRGHHRRKKPSSDDAAATADAPTQSVDVNTADVATLETLPAIGASLAERIVAFRNLNGPFASSDELLDVGGMTAGKVDALSPYVTFR